MINPLKIKEPLLLKFHNEVAKSLMDNNIKFDAQYQCEPSSAFNSVIHYFTEVDGKPRAGFICTNDGKFGGVIAKTERIQYLAKEGFGDEHVSQNEPIYAPAPCSMAFVCMLVMKNLDGLTFTQRQITDFNIATRHI